MHIPLDRCWRRRSVAARAGRVRGPRKRGVPECRLGPGEAVKHRLGRLPLPEPTEVFVSAQRTAHGVSALEVDEEAALHVGKLPDLHRDPFDRMLVAQALVAGFVLLTPDEAIREYPVRTLW